MTKPKETLSDYFHEELASSNVDTSRGEIEPGAVVWLKSGGHKMTVASVESGFAICWSSDGKRVRMDTLPIAVLMLTDPEVIQLNIQGWNVESP